MTRPGCTCAECVPSDPEVSGGSNARCPNGHATVLLSRGRNQKGVYLSVRCATPGCGAHELIYDPLAASISLADRAAKYAHDHHVTRAKAAKRFGVSTNAVIAAWELLYPTKRRTLT